MVSPQPCYHDPRTGRTYDFAEPRWRSDEGHPLMIAAAVRRLAAGGLYAEPTSALAAAAVDELAQRGAIRPGERTVVLLTGTGLKAAQYMTALFSEEETTR